MRWMSAAWWGIRNIREILGRMSVVVISCHVWGLVSSMVFFAVAPSAMCLLR